MHRAIIGEPHFNRLSIFSLLNTAMLGNTSDCDELFAIICVSKIMLASAKNAQSATSNILAADAAIK